MKKILLSCVTCLLALGLVTACDNEEEDVTPEDPNAGVVEPSGDDGGTGGGESGGTETTYKLGVLNENLYSYYYFDGTLDGRFASGTDEWDKGVSLTVTTSEEGSTLSWEEEGVTYYLGYGVNDSNQNIVTITTEVSYLIINEEHDSIEDPSGKYFLGTYNEFTTFSWCGVSYYDSDFVAHLYTSAQTNPIAPAAPEPTGEMVEVETGVLGLYQGNKGNYYYFTGEINSSNFGVLSADFTKAVEVTEWKDDAYYYLTIGSGESLQYIACPATSAARMSLTSEPYCLLLDETTGAFVTGDGKEFLGTYQSYETMSWSSIDYLGQSGQFIATIYKEEQKLPAPSAGDITITGPESVYIGSTITLTASVPLGYDSSFIWTSDNTGYATIEESSTGDTCVVTGASEGETVITVTSAVNAEATATATIKVEPVPAGLIGSFDFSTNTENGTGISASTDLDDFYTGVSGAYLGIRDYSTVYLGNGSGGAFENVTTCIKFGSGNGNGTLQLKFALGTNIEKVVVTAHSWSKGSTSNQLVVNGESKDCSISGTAEELIYEITDDLTYLLTFESVGRVTIHSIDIYGTVGNSYDDVSSITLTADNSNLTEYESTQITVSYLPETALLDIDTLTWSSTDSSVAKVTKNLDGAIVEALASTESVTITAEAENGVKGELTFAISAVDPNTPITTTITYETIMGLEQFSSTEWSTSGQTCFSSTDGVVTAFHGCTVTWYTGTDSGASSNGCAIYTGSSLRIYKYAHFNISAEEGYTISSVVLTTSNVGMFDVTVDGSTTTASNSPVTVTPTTSSEVIFTHNGGSNNPVITSIVIVATPVVS